MKHIKLFEDYNANVHKAIQMSKSLNRTKGYQKIMRILSLIDDIVHLDFRNFKNSIKNKEGFNKGTEMATELGTLVYVLKNEDIPWYNGDLDEEKKLYNDIDQYGIDVDLILDTLVDPDFKDYIENDRRMQKSLEVKYKSIIDILKRYKEWKNR